MVEIVNLNVLVNALHLDLDISQIPMSITNKLELMITLELCTDETADILQRARSASSQITVVGETREETSYSVASAQDLPYDPTNAFLLVLIGSL